MSGSPEKSERRILVASGEDSVRALLVTVLSREGFQVLAFEDAEAALEELRRRPAHLLIASQALPGGGGADLHRKARALHPALQSILIAPEPSAEAASSARPEGAREYVIKPFQVADVLAVCEAAMKMARG